MSWWIIVESSPSQQATNKIGGAYPPGVPIYFSGTKAQATAKANLTVKTGSTSNGPFGPFATKQDAETSWKTGGVNQHAGTGGPLPTPTNPLTGLAAIGDFFTKIGQRETWIRVAEFVIGGGLIYIGIHAMSKGTAIAPLVNAPANIAKTATKATPVGRAASTVAKAARG
jgi:hypothetical protein